MNIKKISKAIVLASMTSILLTGCSGPDDKVVKNIAYQYNIKSAQESDIKIVKGKTVFILEIKGSICEMPMIEINKNWSATGISCRG